MTLPATPATTSLALAWIPVPGATSYEIRYGTSESNLTNLQPTGNVTAASVGGLQAATRYYVAVVARNGPVSGGLSNVVTTRTAGWSQRNP